MGFAEVRERQLRTHFHQHSLYPVAGYTISQLQAHGTGPRHNRITRV